MSRIIYKAPAAASTSETIITVTGQILAGQLTAPGSQAPPFTIPAGPNGRQWLFVYYSIDNVNPAFIVGVIFNFIALNF